MRFPIPRPMGWVYSIYRFKMGEIILFLDISILLSVDDGALDGLWLSGAVEMEDSSSIPSIHNSSRHSAHPISQHGPVQRPSFKTAVGVPTVSSGELQMPRDQPTCQVQK
jgi:hypothetical protein